MRSRLALVIALGAGCASGELRRFPLAEPLWEDRGDFRPFAPMPSEYFSARYWDAVDSTFFGPVSRALAVPVREEAADVNAMDEVPDSSWYENRASRALIPIDRFVRAACGDGQDLDPAGPWTIVSAKPNGANPGFVVEDAAGRKYLLKFDSPSQPMRTTSAEVLGAMLYWAAGYHVPCNRIVLFDRSIMTIDPQATLEVDGEEAPMTWEALEPAFDGATRREDGRYRAVASAWLEGRPVGPFRYEGTRADDPNDVVPHEDRRELRGSYLLAAWILHYDTREMNTLGMWIEVEDGRGYIRHNILDFGDSLGSTWEKLPALSRRIGHSYYFDFRYFFGDLVTLGAVPRPWHHSRPSAASAVLGYFNDQPFEPERFRPGYPNPAFQRATERDLAWMARIMANITEAHVEAAVDALALEDALVRRELTRILLARREEILRRWLGRLSPLTWPRVEVGAGGPRVCLRDLAAATSLVAQEDRFYWTRAFRHERGDALVPLAMGALRRRRPDAICADLPRAGDASADAPAYVIVDVAGLDGPRDPDALPVRLHFYVLAPDDYRLVGLERPYGLDLPGREPRKR